MNLADALRRVNTEGTATPEQKPVAKAPVQPSVGSGDGAAVEATQAALNHLDEVEAVAHEAQLAAQATTQAAMAAEGQVPVVGDGSIPEGVHQHVQSGNVVRLELFLSAEQMSGMFRAIMAGQHTVLTLREAAAFLRISQDSLQKLAEEGEIPGVYIEGRWRFPKANLEDWLTMQSVNHEEGEDVA